MTTKRSGRVLRPGFLKISRASTRRGSSGREAGGGVGNRGKGRVPTWDSWKTQRGTQACVSLQIWITLFAHTWGAAR